jgi:hypothetical protein
MAITPKHIISLSHVRAKLTELCDEVRTRGAKNLLPKMGAAALRSSARIAWIITIG